MLASNGGDVAMAGNLFRFHARGYTNIDNEIFRAKLSWQAKGAYCQICSLPKTDWKFTVRGFASLSSNGVEATTSALRELEDAGFLIRGRYRDPEGKFSSDTYWATLDTPSLYAEAVEYLEDQGIAIVSKFERRHAVEDKSPSFVAERPSFFSGDSSIIEEAVDCAQASDDVEKNVENYDNVENADAVENAKSQVGTRYGFSVSGLPVSGLPRSGKPRSIKYVLDKTTNQSNLASQPDVHDAHCGKPDPAPTEPKPSVSKQAISSSRASDDQAPAAQAAKPEPSPSEAKNSNERDSEDFKRLVQRSMKAVEPDRMERCRKAYAALLERGWSGQQIVSAYDAYAAKYRRDNGSNPRFAKKLDDWLCREDGFGMYAPKRDFAALPDSITCPHCGHKAKRYIRDRYNCDGPGCCMQQFSYGFALRQLAKKEKAEMNALTGPRSAGA